MEQLIKNIDKQIRSTLKIETRYDWARIDGKKTLAEILSDQTINLMKEFNLWVENNYIRGMRFDNNGFYIPKNGTFNNYTLDELLEIFIKKNLVF